MNKVTDGNSGPGFAKYPDYRVTFTPIAEEVVVTLGDDVVCRTSDAIAVLESRHKPALYLPQSALATQFLNQSDTSSYCPFKGTASYQTLVAGNESAEDALWYYPEPFEEVTFIKDYFGVYTDRVTAITLAGRPYESG